MHEKSFGHYISIIYRQMQIQMNHEFSRFGFGSGQYLFFILIAKNKGITQKELSKTLIIDKATTAKAVHKLSELGYIKNRQDENDKRSYHLFLTEKGLEILPDVKAIKQKVTAVLSGGMTGEERQKAFEFFKLLMTNITSHNEKIRSDI